MKVPANRSFVFPVSPREKLTPLHSNRFVFILSVNQDLWAPLPFFIACTVVSSGQARNIPDLEI